MTKNEHSENPVSQDLNAEELSLLQIFFDEDAYLRLYRDVAKANIDAFGHFLTYGFKEGRNPSHAVTQDTLKFLVSKSAAPFEDIPENLSGLVAILRDWPIDAIYGPAILICPSWLSKQPQCAGCQTLAEILQTVIPVGDFALHPAFDALHVSTPMTVKEIIEQIYKDHRFVELSAIDLDEYAAQHRDLSHFKGNGEGTFKHLWTFGALENRLKYLGGRRLTKQSPQGNFISQLKLAFLTRLDHEAVSTPRNATKLTPLNLRPVEPNGEIDGALRFALSKEIGTETPDQAMQHLVSLTQVLDDVSTFVPDAGNVDDTERRSVGSRTLTDQDLMSGAHDVTTKRVVYSVNIGAYDDLPVPPVLEDCSYFLITDAAEVPADTPWTIVRPTIREIDVKRQCLWYKTHPHWLFPKAEFVTWIDSNIQCRSRSESILMSHEMMSEIATFAHPDRNCVYLEAKEIVELQLDSASVIERATAQMKKDGFPEKTGFFETNVLFSRVQDLGVRAFFDTWWRNIYLGSRRDQMSFTFSAWSEGVEISCLDARFSAKDSRFFTKTTHKSKKGRFV